VPQRIWSLKFSTISHRHFRGLRLQTFNAALMKLNASALSVLRVFVPLRLCVENPKPKIATIPLDSTSLTCILFAPFCGQVAAGM